MLHLLKIRRMLIMTKSKSMQIPTSVSEVYVKNVSIATSR